MNREKSEKEGGARAHGENRAKRPGSDVSIKSGDLGRKKEEAAGEKTRTKTMGVEEERRGTISPRVRGEEETSEQEQRDGQHDGNKSNERAAQNNRWVRREGRGVITVSVPSGADVL